MIEFNFFEDTKEILLEKFCEYFKLEMHEIVNYFEENNPDDLSYIKMIKDLYINLDDYDSSEIGIVCRHMTTASEEWVNSFLENGLLDLKSMLQLETPLSEYLKQHGIEVNVDEKRVFIENKEYPILSTDDICVNCFSGERELICTGFSRCELKDKLGHLAVKLYQNNAALEFFINATLEEMEEYSTVNKYPEVLDTLAQILSETQEWKGSGYRICSDWARNNEKELVLEFVVCVSDMETADFIDYNGVYQTFGECITQSGYCYEEYLTHTVPKKVFDNMKFIEWFLSIYFYNGQEYGVLLPGGTVPGDKIKIYEVVNNRLYYYGANN